MDRHDPWRALADPTRRQLLDLMRGGAQPVGALAAACGASQPLVSQHLKVLLEAGLVRVSPRGTSRLYGIQEDGFRSVAEWFAHFESFWDERMDRLSEVLEDA